MALTLSFCVCLSFAQGASPASDTGAPATRVGFPSFLVPQAQPTIVHSPRADLLRIWRNDSAREERLERQYWAEIRATEEGRIRDRYRVETIAALQKAMDAAAARQRALAHIPSPTANTTSEWNTQRIAELPPAARATESLPERGVREIVEKVDQTAATLTTEAAKVIQGLDRAANTIVAPPRDSGTVFFLLLLALFLLPAFGFAMLLLGFIHLRHGHRLQAAVFGVVGGGILALIAASVLDMRATGRTSQRGLAGEARLLAQCKKSEVALSGVMQSTIPEGVLLADVNGAPSDEHGWALIVTAKKYARSGERWELHAYPVGTRPVANASGLIRHIPAYADSIEAAVEWQLESERKSREWWWQRIL